MSAVTIAEAWPKPGEPFTVDDLERMPDDGRRYELIDGMLIVSPAPAMPHQRVAFSSACCWKTPARMTWLCLAPR
jgi:hypothetical protein